MEHQSYVQQQSLPPQPPVQTQQHKRRRKRKRVKREGGETVSLGFFGAVPSLQELQAANRQATKRYFNNGPRAQRRGSSYGHHGGSWRRPTPKTVPPAPEHLTFHFASTDPLLTPAAPAPGTDGELLVDKLAADGLNAAALNMFGTNEGLLFQRDSPSASSGLSEGELGSDAGEVDEIDDMEDGAAHWPTDLPPAVRARLEQQEAHITELEDANLRLRERLDMLQQELDELHAAGHHRAESQGGFDSDAEEVASVMPHTVGALPKQIQVDNEAEAAGD